MGIHTWGLGVRSVLKKLTILSRFAFVIFLFEGCTDSSKKENSSPAVKPKQDASTTTDDPKTEKPGLALKNVYEMVIMGTDGKRLCEGEIELNMLTNANIEVGDASLKCLGYSVPVKQFIPDMNNEEMAGSVEVSGGSGETDKVLRMPSMGVYKFNPPRPMLVGPIIQDTSSLQGYSEERDYIVTGTKDGKAVEMGGKIKLFVLSIDQTYQPSDMKEPLDQVIKWEMDAEGFSKAVPAETLCFERYEMWWNTRPIALARLIIENSASGFMAAEESKPGYLKALDKVSEYFLGKIRIELNLKKFIQPE